MLYIIAGAALVFFALCFYLAGMLTGGKRQTAEEARRWQSERYDTSFYDMVKGDEYTVQAEGGYELHVQLLSAKDARGRYVIISHGYTDNRMGDLKYARFYLEMGYNCIIYDLRGHGVNEKAPTTYGYLEGKDICWLVKDSRQRYSDIAVLGLHGESLGAASTMMALSYQPQVDFAVADCGFSDIENVLKHALKASGLPAFPVDMQNIGLKIRYGISFEDMRPVDGLDSVSLPVMFIHGAQDSFITPDNSAAMYEAIGGYKELHLIDGAGHAESALHAPEEYRKLLGEFLDKVAGQAKDSTE